MYTEQAPGYSRMAAAALLAVSAGACVGVALSPAVSSLYAPVAVRPAVYSQTSAMTVPAVPMRAVSGQYVAQQMAGQQALPTMQSSVSGWTVLAGGLSAAAAALVAFAFKSGNAGSSEQIAMLAAAGKKKSAPVQEERKLWYPTAVAPEYLDGSLPGDRGFDPWGFCKPVEYLQVSQDSLDQNLAKNAPGQVIGKLEVTPDELTGNPLQPYSEVFGLKRFRECELIHGRWAMLAVVGCLVSEAVTGVAWQNAGLVEVTSGSTYFGYALPFTGTQVVWFEVLAMGFAEVARNAAPSVEKRIYPGGVFDPLGLASKDEETTFRLQEAELKHARLAMIAFLGFAVAAGKTGAGATEAFSQWALSFS